MIILFVLLALLVLDFLALRYGADSRKFDLDATGLHGSHAQI